MAAKYIYDLDGCELPFTIKVEVRLKLQFLKFLRRYLPHRIISNQLRGYVGHRRQTGQFD